MRWRIALYALSALPCLLLLALWARSYWVRDFTRWDHVDVVGSTKWERRTYVASGRGRIELSFSSQDIEDPDPAALQGAVAWEAHPDAEFPDRRFGEPTLWRTIGFDYHVVIEDSRPPEERGRVWFYHRIYVVGHWVPAIILAVPPVWGATSLVRRRRLRRQGLCPQCGYDLRGGHASGRCPECGAPAPASDETIEKCKSNK